MAHHLASRAWAAPDRAAEVLAAPPEEAKRVPHSEQLGWLTRGLRPIELRAISHALDHAAAAISAIRFREDLNAAVHALPPPRADSQEKPRQNELFRL